MKKSWLLFSIIGILTIFLASGVLGLVGCCEKTKAGEYCLNIDDSNCDIESGFQFVPTSCESTSFCKLGCCYSSDGGRCFKNTPRAACNAEPNSTYSESAECSIQQCKKGCCVLGDQNFFVTPVMCKKTATIYPDVTMQFDDAVKSERDCLEKSKSKEEGCCAKPDNTCIFTTKANCDIAEYTSLNESLEKKFGFHKDMLCSNDVLACNCAKQQKTACIGEDIYWLDSCGNKENIYDADKRKSYNNGYVLKEADSCAASGPNDPNCGNCMFPKGTVCGKDTAKKMPIGDYTCVGLGCKEVYKDPYSPNSGGAKKNGESWCIYDSQVGYSKDLVGSRHYRHLCINGEEIVETCKDFREEICVQGELGQGALDTMTGFMLSGVDYTEAACRTNRWSDCDACNTLNILPGSPTTMPTTKGSKEPQLLIDLKKSCCNNIDVRDCYWMEAGISDAGGVCVPLVKPGLKHWGSPSVTAATATVTANAKGANAGITATTPTDQTCAKANQECEVIFRIGGFSKIFTSMASKMKSASIIKNEICTKKAWAIAGNNLCKAQGDCGAYFNILGQPGDGSGYINSIIFETRYFDGNTRKLTVSDYGDFKTLINKPSDQKKGTTDLLTKDPGFWTMIAGFGMSGILGAVGSSQQNKSVFSGFGQGLFGGVSALANIGKKCDATKKDAVVGKACNSDNICGDGYECYGMKCRKKQVTIEGQACLPGSTVCGDQYDCVNNKCAKKGPAAPTPVTGTTNTAPTPTQPTTTQAPQGESSETGITPETPAGDYTEQTDSNAATAATGIDAITGGATGIDSITGMLGATDVIGQVAPLAGMGGMGMGGAGYGMGGGGMGMMGGASSNVCSQGFGGKSTSIYGSAGSFGSMINLAAMLSALYVGIEYGAQREATVKYTMTCKPWQAPTGSKDCELCNNNMKPCSEYKCKSIGQNCAIINAGSANETCISLDVNDVNSPVITPNKARMMPYTTTDTTEEANKGVKINEKIRAFAPVMLSILTNEPAQCKYAFDPTTKFDAMADYFGASEFLYNQSVFFSMPSVLTNPNATKVTKGELSVYVRCQDAKGNKNERPFFFKFQADPSPDLTPPTIRFTSIANEGFLKYNESEITFKIYVDEPSTCKWSRRDTGYDLMENTFECVTDQFSQSAEYLATYECATRFKNMTNLENNLYFKCKDKPEATDDKDRNANEDSYKFTLKGTQNVLKITSLSPNGTLFAADTVLSVTTESGSEGGKADCAFSQSDVPFSQMVIFSQTGDAVSQQPLTGLPKGNYQYYISCLDIGANEAKGKVDFTIDIDDYAPKITALYADSFANQLNIVLDEEATCEYMGTETYVFGEGTRFSGTNETMQSTNWSPDVSATHYVQCKDKFGNTGRYTLFV